MKHRSLSLLLIFFSCTSLYSQKKPYKYIYESIDSIVVNHGYEVAKRRIKAYEKRFTLNPLEIQDFVKTSLDSGDIGYFKRKLKFLSRNYGFIYTYKDTIDIQWAYNSNIKKKIYDNDLVDWAVKMNKKNYPKWLAEHYKEETFNQKFAILDEKDQYLRWICSYFTPLDPSYSDSILTKGDYDNFLEVLTIYQLNDSIIPNPFDNGLSYPSGWLIIWHNLKDPNIIDLIWTLLLPYVEKTYATGKIGKHYFEVYDHWLNEFFNEQYYGTLENVPIRDSEHFEERKLKYRL
ncbi:MAG: hypothetical protein COA33_011510 [Fluviicola sp.]|nr:hypothetical protein [Fluviicola sp.]